MGKLIVSLSPHAHGTDTVERNMYGVIIALMRNECGSLRILRVGYQQVYLEAGTQYHYGRLSHPHRSAPGFQPSLKPPHLDHPHWCAFRYRCSQDDLWRSG